jgi:hypothetical protein
MRKSLAGAVIALTMVLAVYVQHRMRADVQQQSAATPRGASDPEETETGDPGDTPDSIADTIDAERSSSQAPSPIAGRALLVGCSTYPKLRGDLQLPGPANDVALYHNLLRTQFGFDPEKITVLAASDDFQRALRFYPGENPASRQEPTSDNIRAAFSNLIEATEAGEYVFILLSGHGSQEHDVSPSDTDPEPDGYDETFMAMDVPEISTDGRRVPNAVIDDEIRDWLAKLVRKDAFVFVLIDACHSGTMTRDGTRARRIPSEMIGIKHVDVDDGESPVVEEDWLDAVGSVDGHRGVVALYAARSNQLAYELGVTKQTAIKSPTPQFRSSADAASHGRLAYTVARILETTRQNLTYEDLLRHVIHRYATHPGHWLNASTPDMQGTDLQRYVLGRDREANPWPLRLSHVDAELQLSGGLIHGLAPGSVLAVYPPTGPAETTADRTGYVRVTAADLLAAEVEPYHWDGVRPPADFDELSRCEVVLAEPGELGLHVRVSAERFESEAAAGEAIEHLRQALKRSLGSTSLVRIVEPDAPFDWDIVATPVGASVRKAGATCDLDDPAGVKTGQVCPLIPADGQLEERLSELLRAIARGHNLMEIAARSTERDAPGVFLEVRLFRNEVELTEEHGSPPAVRPSDTLRISIKNTNPSRTQQPLSVAIWYVNSACQVSTIFPFYRFEHDANQIRSGRELYVEHSGSRQPIEIDIGNDFTGCEQIIVAAAPAGDQAFREGLRAFRYEEATLPRDGDAYENPLVRLLASAATGYPRSDPQRDLPTIGSYEMRCFPIQVMEDAGP